jgi:hypothetical protein
LAALGVWRTAAEPDKAAGIFQAWLNGRLERLRRYRDGWDLMAEEVGAPRETVLRNFLYLSPDDAYLMALTYGIGFRRPGTEEEFEMFHEWVAGRAAPERVQRRHTTFRARKRGAKRSSTPRALSERIADAPFLQMIVADIRRQLDLPAPGRSPVILSSVIAMLPFLSTSPVTAWDAVALRVVPAVMTVAVAVGALRYHRRQRAVIMNATAPLRLARALARGGRIPPADRRWIAALLMPDVNTRVDGLVLGARGGGPPALAAPAFRARLTRELERLEGRPISRDELEERLAAAARRLFTPLPLDPRFGPRFRRLASQA